MWVDARRRHVPGTQGAASFINKLYNKLEESEKLQSSTSNFNNKNNNNRTTPYGLNFKQLTNKVEEIKQSNKPGQQKQEHT